MDGSVVDMDDSFLVQMHRVLKREVDDVAACVVDHAALNLSTPGCPRIVANAHLIACLEAELREVRGCKVLRAIARAMNSASYVDNAMHVRFLHVHATTMPWISPRNPVID